MSFCCSISGFNVASQLLNLAFDHLKKVFKLNLKLNLKRGGFNGACDGWSFKIGRVVVGVSKFYLNVS